MFYLYVIVTFIYIYVLQDMFKSYKCIFVVFEACLSLKYIG